MIPKIYSIYRKRKLTDKAILFLLFVCIPLKSCKYLYFSFFFPFLFFSFKVLPTARHCAESRKMFHLKRKQTMKFARLRVLEFYIFVCLYAWFTNIPWIFHGYCYGVAEELMWLYIINLSVSVTLFFLWRYLLNTDQLSLETDIDTKNNHHIGISLSSDNHCLCTEVAPVTT